MTRNRMATLLMLAVLTLSLSACQNAKAPASSVPPPSLAAEAAEALEAGNYAKAADRYRGALAAAPDSVPLHYGLAVAASHLNLKDEAIREFRWVMDRAPKGSPEVEAARRWLAQAGVLVAQEALAPAPADEALGGGTDLASLEGRMILTDPGQEGRPAQRRMVVLYGLPGTPTQDERHQTRTDQDGRFQFKRLAPGSYMVTDAVAGVRNWRLRVLLRPGQSVTLDLSSANSTKVRDDFSG